MLTFSTNPEVAEQQMNAIIFYLTAFGYIDGEFDFTEKTFVRIYIRQLVTARAKMLMPDAPTKTRDEIIAKFVAHFHEVFEQVDHQVKALFDEAVADGENVENFVYAKLKLRSYAIFQTFDRDNQQELLSTIDELIYADGTSIRTRRSSARRSRASSTTSHAPRPRRSRSSARTKIALADRQPAALLARLRDHPFFQKGEQHYSDGPARIPGADRAPTSS